MRRPGLQRSGPLPVNPHSVALRAAGLRVTSARLAVLHLAPALLKQHGCLTPQTLHEACRRKGYAFSLTAFYHVLPALTAAGLLPAQRFPSDPGIAGPSLDHPEP